MNKRNSLQKTVKEANKILLDHKIRVCTEELMRALKDPNQKKEVIDDILEEHQKLVHRRLMGDDNLDLFDN